MWVPKIGRTLNEENDEPGPPRIEGGVLAFAAPRRKKAGCSWDGVRWVVHAVETTEQVVQWNSAAEAELLQRTQHHRTAVSVGTDHKFTSAFRKILSGTD
jgi:hypothetical protein